MRSPGKFAPIPTEHIYPRGEQDQVTQMPGDQAWQDTSDPDASLAEGTGIWNAYLAAKEGLLIDITYKFWMFEYFFCRAAYGAVNGAPAISR